LLRKTAAAFFRFVFIIACFAAAGSQSLRADHTTIGAAGGSAGPINTLSAGTLAQGHWAIGTSTDYTSSKGFSDAEIVRLAGEHAHPHSADYVMTISTNASYGFTDDFMLSVRVPYVHRSNIRSGKHSHVEGTAINEVENLGSSSGMGDLMLLGKYRFRRGEGAQLEPALLLGLELPTGETDKRANGERLEAEHQPGSGSWDPIFGFAVSKRFGAYSVDAGALYNLVTKGSQDTDIGDRASYGLAVSYRLGGEPQSYRLDGKPLLSDRPTWDLMLELNGEWFDRQRVGGEVERDSGGNQVFLSPGVRFTGGPHWTAHLSVGIPVVNELRRSHPDTGYKVLAGLNRAF
jgi:hypothetical protein